MKYKVTGLNELSKQFSDFQTRIGFTDSNVVQRLMLVHSEVSECFEAYRKGNFAFIDNQDYIVDGRTVHEELVRLIENEDLGNFKIVFEKQIKDSMQDEAADVIIRMLAFCAENEIDIESHIKLKMTYNELRGFKYGGKKF